MNNNIIKVGMAELKVVERPYILTTIGLGSCVGVALYDRTTGISGLAHIMLPDSKIVKNNTNLAKFADTAITELLRQMTELGANKFNLVAKIAGGARMFSFPNSNSSLLNIGERNIDSVIENLKLHNVYLKSMDVGENYGRTIELCSLTGILTVKTIGHGVREI